MIFFILMGCSPSLTVKHFEATLTVQPDDGFEVIYRIPFRSD